MKRIFSWHGCICSAIPCNFITVNGADPGKYHETISWFSMLLIAERRSIQKTDTWQSFCRDHPDLFARGDENILNRYYSSELLDSDHARRSFMLPDKLA